MNDDIFIDTILEAQAILARHIAGEHASAEETIAKLMQLLDGTELVKAYSPPTPMVPPERVSRAVYAVPRMIVVAQ